MGVLDAVARRRDGALVLGALAFTVAGMTVAPPPPSAQGMAASSLVAIAIVCAGIGRRARRAPNPNR